MEFLIVVLLAVILVLIAVLGLALRIVFKKGGKFPNIHIGRNKYLAGRGVYCARTQDRLEQDKYYNRVDYKKVKYKT
jgi:hypothetical protein